MERGTNELRRFNALVAKSDAAAANRDTAEFARYRLESYVLRAALTIARDELVDANDGNARESVVVRIAGLPKGRPTQVDPDVAGSLDNAHEPSAMQVAAMAGLVENVKAYHRSLTSEGRGPRERRLLEHERQYRQDQYMTSLKLITVEAVRMEGTSAAQKQHLSDARARYQERRRLTGQSGRTYAMSKGSAGSMRRPVWERTVRALHRGLHLGN